jgi:hypothetical protein
MARTSQWISTSAQILHQALRIEFWGYTNQVRLRGLTENQGFCNLRRQVLFVSLRFQPLGARCESGEKRQRHGVRNRRN